MADDLIETVFYILYIIQDSNDHIRNEYLRFMPVIEDYLLNRRSLFSLILFEDMLPSIPRDPKIQKVMVSLLQQGSEPIAEGVCYSAACAFIGERMSVDK